jgi:hypothetical protein
MVENNLEISKKSENLKRQVKIVQEHLNLQAYVEENFDIKLMLMHASESLPVARKNVSSTMGSRNIITLTQMEAC